MSEIKPQYGHTLCAADDPQRTHWRSISSDCWHSEPAGKLCKCEFCLSFTYQKPIPLPDGKEPTESAWEFVPEGDRVGAGDFCYNFSDWFGGLDVSVGKTVKEALGVCPSRLAFARRKSKPVVDKLAVEAGYRLLEAGEVIEASDEVKRNDGWGTVTMAMGGALLPEYVGFYRRKIAPPVTPKSGEWVSVKDGLPKKAGRFVVVNHSDRKPHCTNWNGSEFALNPKPYAWLEIPPVPDPPKTDAEKAWEEYEDQWGEHQPGFTPKVAFLAGYAAKENQTGVK